MKVDLDSVSCTNETKPLSTEEKLEVNDIDIMENSLQDENKGSSQSSTKNLGTELKCVNVHSSLDVSCDKDDTRHRSPTPIEEKNSDDISNKFTQIKDLCTLISPETFDHLHGDLKVTKRTKKSKKEVPRTYF